jgi:pSer/pThr/pTyr-binding forkhead associated (FHA) protein
MNAVLVMFWKGEKREFPLKDGATVIGRRQDCQLRVPTQDVSRQHCEIRVERNTLTVRDLGSANGTYVNGKRIAEQKLAPGDRLGIGPVVFIVQINGAPARIKPEDAIVSAAATGAPATKSKVEEEEEVFELGEEDLELSDPLSALEELEEERDKP